MIDSGATGIFMSPTVAALHGIPIDPLRRPQQVTVIDGRPLHSGAIPHSVNVPLNVFGHMEIINFHGTDLGGYDHVLGIPWLQKQDVRIEYRKYYLSFPMACQDHVTVAHSPQPPHQPDSRINAAPTPSTPPRPSLPPSPVTHRSQGGRLQKAEV